MKNVWRFIFSLFLIIIMIYSVTIIFKVTILLHISFNANKIKNSDEYSYYKSQQSFIDYTDLDKNYIVERPKHEYHVYNNGEIQKIDSFDSGRFMTYFNTQWNYYNVNNKEHYSTTAYLNEPIDDPNNNYRMSYDYQKGFSYEKKSPYGLIMYALDDFYRMEFVLNPFKKIDIDFGYGDYILTRYDKDTYCENVCYEKNVYYLDIITGTVRKIETFTNDELTEISLFWNYNLTQCSEEYVKLDESYETEIKINAEKEKKEYEEAKNNDDV